MINSLWPLQLTNTNLIMISVVETPAGKDTSTYLLKIPTKATPTATSSTKTTNPLKKRNTNNNITNNKNNNNTSKNLKNKCIMIMKIILNTMINNNNSNNNNCKVLRYPLSSYYPCIRKLGLNLIYYLISNSLLY